MKLLALIAVLLAISLPVRAAKKPVAKAPPKPITIKKLIERALTHGESSTLEQNRASSLGYSGPQRIKDYTAAELTKDTQIGIEVTFRPDSKTTKDIVLSSTTVTEWAGETPVSIDGYSYRATLDGSLIAMFRTTGKVGDLVHEKLTINHAVKAHFEKLKSDLLRSSNPK